MFIHIRLYIVSLLFVVVVDVLLLLHLQAIHGYRETERDRWSPECEKILSRVRSVAFNEGSSLLGPVHILDLDKSGYIKPHVDSVKVLRHFLSLYC